MILLGILPVLILGASIPIRDSEPMGKPYLHPERDLSKAKVISADDSGVEFRTDKGVERWGWWDLDLATAARMGKETGIFWIIDQRHTKNGTTEVARTLTAIKCADGIVHYGLINDSRGLKSAGREMSSFGSMEKPPSFIDDNTLITMPNNCVVAWRCLLDDITMDCIKLTKWTDRLQAEKKLSDGKITITNLPYWRVSIEHKEILHSSFYDFFVFSTGIPPVPIRSTNQLNSFTYGGREYHFNEIEIKHSSPTIGEWQRREDSSIGK